MRTSCNGCRVLRKGCSDDCSIRPSLLWIKSPDSQANATVFLAKFYGRAGLLNLLNAAPSHLRPAIFQSLLYEACGRVVDPVYGSVGLLYSGQWHHCQTAVDAVLKGLPIMQLPNAASQQLSLLPPLKLYDIRHMSTTSSTTTTSPPHPHQMDHSSHHSPQNIRTRSCLKPRPRIMPDSDRLSNVSNHGDLFSVDTTQEQEEGGEGEMRLELTLGYTYGGGDSTY